MNDTIQPATTSLSGASNAGPRVVMGHDDNEHCTVNSVRSHGEQHDTALLLLRFLGASELWYFLRSFSLAFTLPHCLRPPLFMIICGD